MGSRELGELIRAARLRKGWQQNDLADKLGVAPGYLSAIENGDRKWPQTYIPDLSKHLGISEIDMAVAAGLISASATEPRKEEVSDPKTERLLERLRPVIQKNNGARRLLEAQVRTWEED